LEVFVQNIMMSHVEKWKDQPRMFHNPPQSTSYTFFLTSVVAPGAAAFLAAAFGGAPPQ
jgi:hypothetical protein